MWDKWGDEKACCSWGLVGQLRDHFPDAAASSEEDAFFPLVAMAKPRNAKKNDSDSANADHQQAKQKQDDMANNNKNGPANVNVNATIKKKKNKYKKTKAKSDGVKRDAVPLGSNWLALKASLGASEQDAKAKKNANDTAKRAPLKSKRRITTATSAAVTVSAHVGIGPTPPCSHRGAEPTDVVAVDCEMVAIRPKGIAENEEVDALARVCIVNSRAEVVMDTFVAVSERVTDFRTRVSGVRPADIRGAPSFDAVRRTVSTLLEGRVVVGHGLENDFAALQVSHPATSVRDTARYPPFTRRFDGVASAARRAADLMAGNASKTELADLGPPGKPRKLRDLAAEQLGMEIQQGEHSPVHDARACMYLYTRHRKRWEQYITRGC